MKKLLKSICFTLCLCISVPLFTACVCVKQADSAAKTATLNSAAYNYIDFSKPLTTSVMAEPEYTLPALGTVLETVTGVYNPANAWCDYARYDDVYSLELHADGKWYQRNGTRVYPKSNSPLKGKTIYWLGSSETLGVWTETSTADALAAITDSKMVKNAFGGSTMLVDRSLNVGFGQRPDRNDNNSVNGRHLGEFNFIDRLNPDFPGSTAFNGYKAESWSYTMFDKTADVDAFVVAISTNDAGFTYCGKTASGLIYNATDYTKQYWGTIKNDVFDKNYFNVSTAIGAMEYMVAYIWENWHCPVFFYSSPYFGNASDLPGNLKPNVLQGKNKNIPVHEFDAHPSKISFDPQGSTYALEIYWAKLIAEKWNRHGVPVRVIDMYNDPDFNAMGDTLYEVKNRENQSETLWMSYYQWAMADHVHAKNAGYIQWWAPYVEWFLSNSLLG